MSLESFVRVNFRGKALALIDQANAILTEYAAQGFTLPTVLSACRAASAFQFG